MAALEGFEDIIRAKVEQERWTHGRLRQYLQHEYPRERERIQYPFHTAFLCSVKGINTALVILYYIASRTWSVSCNAHTHKYNIISV